MVAGGFAIVARNQGSSAGDFGKSARDFVSFARDQANVFGGSAR
jgi:hypothetical protein